MSALPQAMTLHEQNQAVLVELPYRRDRFLSLLESVPENLRDIYPADGHWSLMDGAEHIDLAEEFMSVSLQPRRRTDAEPDLRKDGVIQKMALDRSRKIVAPEPARPTGRYHLLAEAAELSDPRAWRELAALDLLAPDGCLRYLSVCSDHGFASGTARRTDGRDQERRRLSRGPSLVESTLGIHG